MEFVAVAVIAALCAAGAGAMVVRSRRAEAARAEAIAARGWRYARTGRGFRIEGGDTVPWTLTLTRSRSSGSGSGGSTQTVWETPAAATSSVVLIGPKLPAAIAGLDLGGALVQLALRAVLGDDGKDLATAREIVLGSEAFRERCSVIASDPALAAEILTPEIEAALLQTAVPSAAVLRWRDRLQIRSAAGLWDAEEIAALVALGTDVAQRCGYGP